MNVWSLIRQRCWGLVLVMFGVCVITFTISHLIPGDPARLLAGDRASEEIVQHIRQQLGLDQPLYVQFGRYVLDLLHGDLGTSIRTGRPVLEDLRAFFPATLELAFCALLLAIAFGVPLGVVSAVYRNKWPDHLVRLLSVTGISTPAFWLGLGVIILFYGETESIARRRQTGRLAGSSHPHHRVLPAGLLADRQRRGVLEQPATPDPAGADVSLCSSWGSGAPNPLGDA